MMTMPAISSSDSEACSANVERSPQEKRLEQLTRWMGQVLGKG